jgi:hypothetical protein
LPNDESAKPILRFCGLAAKAETITEKTLRRAAKVLNVRKEKSGMTGGWVWSLPAPKMAKPPEDAEDGQDSHGGQGDHLRLESTRSPLGAEEDGQDSLHRKVGHLLESWPSSGTPEGGLVEEEI